MSEVTTTSSHSSVPLIALLCRGVVQWVSGVETRALHLTWAGKETGRDWGTEGSSSGLQRAATHLLGPAWRGDDEGLKNCLYVCA